MAKKPTEDTCKKIVPPVWRPHIRMVPLSYKWDSDCKRPSVSLWIRQHLTDNNMDYGYRMWKLYGEAMKKKNPNHKIGSWASFKNYVYWLHRLGLIRRLEMGEIARKGMDPYEEPAKDEDGPVTQRRGKQDFVANWYELVPDAEAMASLNELATKGKMLYIYRDRCDPEPSEERLFKITNEVFDTWIHNPKTKKDIQLHPLLVAWNDPRRALYSKTYESHEQDMKQARHKPRGMGMRQLSHRQLMRKMRDLENEAVRRGYVTKKREFTQEEIKEAEVPKRITAKLQKQAERQTRRMLGAISQAHQPKDIAMEEIQLMSLAATIEYGGLDMDQDRERVKAVDGLIRLYELNNNEVDMAIDKGSSEAFRMANEPDRSRVCFYITEMVKKEVSTPLTDLRHNRIVFKEMSRTTRNIARALGKLHRISDVELAKCIHEGELEGGRDADILMGMVKSSEGGTEPKSTPEEPDAELEEEELR